MSWQKNINRHLLACELTHCGLVMPNDNKDLSQHCFMWWIGAWRHQSITWTNVGLSSVRSSGMHLRAILQEISQPPINIISLWITCLMWMALDFIPDQSTLVQVMAWCHQATSHYLSQCRPRFLSPYDVTRPQWVNVGTPSSLSRTSGKLWQMALDALCFWNWNAISFNPCSIYTHCVILTYQ